MSKDLSQVSCIGLPQPKTWDDYENGCMGTFRGGHHDEVKLKAFQHGMATVFNLLRAEFPPAEQCKAAADLVSAIKKVEAYFQRLEDDAEPGDPLKEARRIYHKPLRDVMKAAIAKAEGPTHERPDTHRQTDPCPVPQVRQKRLG